MMLKHKSSEIDISKGRILKKYKTTGTAAVFLMFVCSVSFGALDIYPASWRTAPAGQSPTTFQSWDFLNDTLPAIPDDDKNPFGQASLTIEDSGASTPISPAWYFNYGGHEGVWECPGQAIVDLPTNPTEYTKEEIHIQMFYNTNDGKSPVVTIFRKDDPADTIELGEDDLVGVINFGDGYYYATYNYEMDPKLAFESLSIKTSDDSMFLLDELIIESNFTPEPASLMLLGSGWLILRSGRRKKIK